MINKEAANKLSTLRDVLRFAVSHFHAANLFYGHGTTNAHEEAVYLILAALNLPYNSLDIYLDAHLLPCEIKKLLDLIGARITKRIPVPYLTHKAWQGEYEFYVDQRVIIPRSFIHQLLPEALLPWIKNTEKIQHILDLCTGSACLAIQMAHLYPVAKIDATDISADALAVAAINIQHYQCHHQIQLICSNLLNNIPRENRYDLIVANPPYVSDNKMAHLPPEYRHEPVVALHAIQDGLATIHHLIKEVYPFLNEEGIFLMEVGRHNKAKLEKANPNLAFFWLDTPDDEGAVCLLTKNDLAKIYLRQRH